MSFPGSPHAALTFGVEMKFCVASLNEGFEDPHPNAAPKCIELDAHLERDYIPEYYYHDEYRKLAMREWFVHIQIAETLSAAGFPAITEKQIYREPHRYDEKERLRKWLVTDDCSIKKPNTDTMYSWYNIEINSPAYYFTPEAVTEVTKGCAVLKQNFRIHINGSMGLHVHVGSVEPQLDRLHPKYRIGNSFCQSISNSSSLMSHPPRPGPGTDRTWSTRRKHLEEILRTQTEKDIVLSMSSPHLGYKLAYNLLNLDTGATKQTIEFRQHESTLDGERIANWVRTCVGLVEVPYRQSSESIETLLRAHVDESVDEFDVIKVLLALNLTAEANFYDTRFHSLWVENGKSLPAHHTSESCSDDEWGNSFGN